MHRYQTHAHGGVLQCMMSMAAPPIVRAKATTAKTEVGPGAMAMAGLHPLPDTRAMSSRRS